MNMASVRITLNTSESNCRSHELTAVRSIASPEWLKKQIAKTYAIDPPLSCRLVESGSNDKYQLQTTGKHFLIRVCQAGSRSVPQVCYELKLLSHLASRGVSVPTPIAGRDGQVAYTLKTPEGIRTVALFTYPRGTCFAWDTEESSRLAGRTLALIHQTTDGFTCEYPRPSLDLVSLLKGPMAALEPLLAARRPQDWAYLKGFAEQLAEHAQRILHDDLDWGVCHGNLHRKQMFLTEQGELAVLDFDDCGPGWRGFDLVAVQYARLYLRQDSRWNAFFQGYQEVRSLCSADIAALPLFHVLSQMRYFGVVAANVTQTGALHPLKEKLDRLIGYFRDWEAQHFARPFSFSNAFSSLSTTPERTTFGSAVVSRTVLCGKSLAAVASECYSLADPVECQLLQHSSNDTYLLTTREGCYIARLHGLPGRPQTEILYELELLAHLAGKGVPVAAPLRSRQQEFMCGVAAPEGVRQLVLFQYCTGERWSWKDEGQAYLAGRLAAAIHNSSRDFQTQHARPAWDLKFLADLPISALEDCERGRTADRAYLRELIADLKSRVAALQRADLSWGICHGDFHSKNIVHADGAAKIFDFDHCGPSWLALDFIWVSSVARRLNQPGIWTAFLQGYREMGFLSPSDLQLVPLLLGLMHVWRLKHAGLCLGGEEEFDRRLSKIRRWHEEYLKGDSVLAQ